MRIAVIVATYNRAPLLRDCLAALQVQRYEPGDEVIVVDNASTDETPALIDEAAARFPVPVRRVRETTPGKTPALNAGVAVATADVLALTDDDVMVAGDWLATVRRLFLEEPDLAVVGGRVDPRWERPAPRWLHVESDGHYDRMASPLALLHYGPRQNLGSRTAVGANMAVRRQVLETVGGFDPHLGRIRGTLMCGEDHEFCQRVVRAGLPAVYTPDLVVRHWVPAERTRLRYYLRWFFWSGVTNAMLDLTSAGRKDTRPGVPPYLWRRLVAAPGIALLRLLTGRTREAAMALLDATFAAGYIWKRLTAGRERQETSDGHQQAPQLPVSTRSPAIPIPGTEAGKLIEKEG
jgi:glucosyl-dolichyl phosphate glucuronosyltransferase